MTRVIPLVLSVIFGACAPATSGMNATLPLRSEQSFASKIKRIKIRTLLIEALHDNHPYQRAQRERTLRERIDKTTEPPAPPGVDQHHPTALKTAVLELERKGYSVTVVWDDPYGYGERPCIGPKPDDPQYSSDEIFAFYSAGKSPPRPAWLQKCYDARAKGYRGIYMPQLSQYTGSLAEDEAFLELTTWSDSDTYTTTQTYSTETHAGRVTDASGNTIANLYTTGQETRTTQHTRKDALVTVQVFVASEPTPIYDAQAWTKATTSLIEPTQRILAPIPARSATR